MNWLCVLVQASSEESDPGLRGVVMVGLIFAVIWWLMASGPKNK